MRIIPIVAVIHQNDLQFRLLLLQRRSTEGRWANLWCLPGGKIEQGEDELTCATRELFEETGLSLDLSKVKRVGLPCKSNSNMYFELFITHVPGEAPPSIQLEQASFQGFGWFSYPELEELDVHGWLMEPAGIFSWVNSMHPSVQLPDHKRP